MHTYTTSRIALPSRSPQPALPEAFEPALLQPLSFFPAGAEIYAQGEKAGPFYQVEFGAVRIYRLLADGRRQISAFHLAGETFGFEADSTHHFFAEAINATGIRVFRFATGADVYSPEVGDTYTFLGLASDSKLILAHHVGRRSHEDADAFAGKLRLAVAGRTQINTDGFRPYRSVIPVNFGGDVDHAVLVKRYGSSPDGEGAQRRYSPAQIIGIDRERSFGSPDMTRLSTSYGERLNLSVRMGLRRFSMSPAFIPSIKQLARMVSIVEAQQMVAAVMKLTTTRQVQQFMTRQLERLAPDLTMLDTP